MFEVQEGGQQVLGVEEAERQEVEREVVGKEEGMVEGESSRRFVCAGGARPHPLPHLGTLLEHHDTPNGCPPPPPPPKKENLWRGPSGIVPPCIRPAS